MEKVRILLVDGEERVRNGMRYRLEQEEDIKIVGECISGEEALSKVELLSPNIVLMDTWLPGVNGIEACRKLTRSEHACDVIMLTPGQEFINDALKAGAVSCFPKALNYEELVTAVRLACRWRLIKAEFNSNTESVEQPETAAAEKRPRFVVPEVYVENEPESSPEEDNGSASLPEVMLEIASTDNATQLQRFIYQVRETFQTSVTETVSSWRGTCITLRLRKARLLENILDVLMRMPEVEEVEEKTPVMCNPLSFSQDTEAVMRKRISLVLSRQNHPIAPVGQTDQYIELPELEPQAVDASVR